MSQIEHLNVQLATARQALTAALGAGEDTSTARADVVRIEAAIVDAERTARAVVAELARAETEAVADAAAKLAEDAHQAIQAAAEVPGLAEAIGAPLPALERDPAIDGTAAEVARCRAILAKAEAVHKPVVEKVATLQRRLAEKTGAIESIKCRRMAGDEHASDAADLAMLTADTEALRQLHDEAKLMAAESDTRPQARATLAGAEQLHALQLKKAAFAATVARVRHAETLFIASWSSMVAAGRAAGSGSPWSAFQPSPELRRAVTGQIVPGFRGSL